MAEVDPYSRPHLMDKLLLLLLLYVFRPPCQHFTQKILIIKVRKVERSGSRTWISCSSIDRYDKRICMSHKCMLPVWMGITCFIFFVRSVFNWQSQIGDKKNKKYTMSVYSRRRPFVVIQLMCLWQNRWRFRSLRPHYTHIMTIDNTDI